VSDPRRLKDDPAAAPELQELVRAGRPSRPISPEARTRSGARLRSILLVPAAAGALLWIKGVAIAALCVSGVVAAVRVSPFLLAGVAALAPASPRAPSPLTSSASRARSVGLPGVLPGASSLAGEAPPVTLPHLEVRTSDAPAAASGAVAPPSRDATRSASPPPVRASLRGAGPAGASPSGPVSGLAAPPSSVLAAGPGAASPALRDSLAREAALLEQARGELAGRPSEALATLDRHAAEFPSGAMSMERELLAVDALRRLGRQADARTRGHTLMTLAAGSIYEARVRDLVESLDAP